MCACIIPASAANLVGVPHHRFDGRLRCHYNIVERIIQIIHLGTHGINIIVSKLLRKHAPSNTRNLSRFEPYRNKSAHKHTNPSHIHAYLLTMVTVLKNSVLELMLQMRKSVWITIQKYSGSAVQNCGRQLFLFALPHNALDTATNELFVHVKHERLRSISRDKCQQRIPDHHSEQNCCCPTCNRTTE